jgi:ferric-dicitrate binding protein FerR (iron transport regulator)
MKNREFVNSEFKTLLEKFQTGICNLEELRQLEEIFLDPGIAEKLKVAMIDEIPDYEMNGSDKEMDYDRLFKSIQKNITKQQTTRRITSLKMNFVRIAAIFVVTFLVGGTLSYFIFNSKPIEVLSYCEVSASLGSKSEIVLPDKTHVWLNAGSKIKYSTQFNRDNRMIYLEGEGYFKVAKNRGLPFIVDAFGFEVKAIGTEFNVKAYKDDATIETTMVEGKVTLQHSTENILADVFLVSNQRATFFKTKETLTIEAIKELEEKTQEYEYKPDDRLVIVSKISPKSKVSWKENQLIIEREKLSVLVEQLNRKYNFTFVFKTEDIKRFRFTGTLEDETLQQVMDAIKISAPIDYTIVGKTVIIERNDKRVPAFEKLLKKQ